MPLTHKRVKEHCESLGLEVTREPSLGAELWNARAVGVRVFWYKSTTSDYLVGLPRVVCKGADTHARSLHEIKYLVSR